MRLPVYTKNPLRFVGSVPEGTMELFMGGREPRPGDSVRYAFPPPRIPMPPDYDAATVAVEAMAIETAVFEFRLIQQRHGDSGDPLHSRYDHCWYLVTSASYRQIRKMPGFIPCEQMP